MNVYGSSIHDIPQTVNNPVSFSVRMFDKQIAFLVV